MKKIFSTIMMTAMVCGFMSCGNFKTPATEKSETEVTELEQKDDTAMVDTAVTRGETESEGFGRCLQSGCYCKGFEGRGETCRNCGHAFKKHY